MEAVTVAQRMTADEYLTGPEDSWPRTQLIEGEVVEVESTPLHQIVALELIAALREWTKAKAGRGTVLLPIDVRLDGRNVYSPDLLWYAEGRGPTKQTRPPSPMPDIAVEVRSPSTWRYDIGAKKAGYERHGLRELWLVDTAAGELLAFRRSAASTASFDVALGLATEDVLSSPLLPGFSLALAELFGDES